MSEPTRRTVLCGLLLGLVAPVSLAACSTESTPSTTPSGNAPGGGTAGGTKLAALSDVPVGSGAIVAGPAGKILLVRTSET
ncbi:MAG: Rieske (2Fe-2S) protein, partial [Kibdelosporangium sp.]